MNRRLAIAVLALVLDWSVSSLAQEVTGLPEASPSPTARPQAVPDASTPPTVPPPTPAEPQQPQKRGWSSRLLHPFSGGKQRDPDYKNGKLKGLFLDLQLSPQPVKLSEVRQLTVQVTLTNKSKRAVTLDFPNDQRIDIQLLNSAESVLTRWSDNHAIKEKPGTLLINPQEHVEYKETIATRDLSPDKVYTVEVFFPKYPELRVRQKFLPAP